MASNQDLNVRFRADTSDLDKGLSSATAKLKHFGDTAKESAEPMKKFGESLKRGLELAGLAIGLSEVANLLKESGREAVAAAKDKAELARAVTAVTGATAKQNEEVEKGISRLELMSSVSALQLRPAFADLVRATGDTAVAQKNLGLALDISAAKHKDLGAVAAALARAHNGNWNALNKLVPGLKDASDKMGFLEKQFSGAAETASKTDPYTRMTTAFTLMKEALGSALIPALNKMADWLDEIVPKVQQFFKDLNDPTTQTGQNWAILRNAVDELNTSFGNLFGTVASSMPGMDTAFSGFISFMTTGIAGIVALLADLMAAFGRLGSYVVRSTKMDFGWLTEQPKDPLANWNKLIDKIRNDKNALIRDTAASKQMNDYAALFPDSGQKGGTYGTFKGPKTTVTPAKEIKAYLLSVQQDIDKAQETFRQATEKADEAYRHSVQKADEAFAQSKLKAEQTRDDATIQLNKDHAKKVLDIQYDFNKRFKDIIQQSMDILRGAFASGTAFDVGSVFADITAKAGTAMTQVIQTIKNGVTTTVSFWGTSVAGGVDGLLATMKAKLTAMKDLQANAAALQGAGFSQAFIAQVVQSGPDVGNKLAKAILDSTPETQKAMAETYNAIQDTSEHGLDGLAKTIYDTQGLQTDAIKKMYTETTTEMAKALADEQTAYTDAQAAITKTFDQAMVDANYTRNQALLDAKYTFDQAIKDANQSLLDSLTSIEQAMTAKLLTFKGTLKAFAAEIAKLRNEIATGITSAQNVLDVPVYNSQGFTTSGNVSAPGSFMNTVGYNNSVTVNATTNATPQAIADTAVLALKYGTPLSMMMA